MLPTNEPDLKPTTGKDQEFGGELSEADLAKVSGGATDTEMMFLQTFVESKEQLYQMIPNISKTSSDTQNAVISNLKG